MILPFGLYRGRTLEDADVPDSYIGWLALRKSYVSPTNRFETTWKVPIDISIAARREMERRGYKRIDDRYEKVGGL